MRYIRYIYALLVLSLTLVSSAQTRVEKHTVPPGRNGGVVYYLPNTFLKVDIETEQVYKQAGEYALYARQFVGVKSPISENSTTFELKKASISSYGVPNRDEGYQVQFKDKTVAPFVVLTNGGLLCAINEDYAFEKNEQPVTPDSEDGEYEEKDFIVQSQDFISATTPLKKAEILASELQRVRETKMNVISGDAEQPFPDGQAMKIAVDNLNKRERQLTEMFTGKESSKLIYNTVDGLQADSAMTYVAFRFSPRVGVVDKDDLSGEPVYMQISIEDKAPEMTPKEAAKAEKALKGVVYFNPGRIRARLVYKDRVLDEKSIPIAQLGIRESLAPVLFNTKRGGVVKVVFYPETGAIKEITEAIE